MLLAEEYGERHWIWRTGMPPKALRSWWETQWEWPGKATRLPGTIEWVDAVLFEGDGNHEVWSRRADADEPHSPEYDIRMAPAGTFKAHMFRNDDSSGLWTPTGEKIRHAGHDGDRVYFTPGWDETEH